MLSSFDPVIFKRQAKPEQKRQVVITRQAADGIITFAKSHHPNEAILVLKGKSRKDRISVEGLVVPPFSMSGPYYSGFSDFHLPLDGSYIGMAHSHPGPSNKPSLEDLHNFFGIISVIISHPYDDSTIGAYDRNGNSFEVVIG